MATGNGSALQGGYGVLTPRKKYIRHRDALVNQRSSWDDHYYDLSKFFSPRMGKYLKSSTASIPQRGRIRHNAIYDTTPLFARRTLTAGLMSGLTSPARPWFKLKLADRSLMEYKPVQIWLGQVERLLQDIFRASNLYRVLPQIYKELSVFGTHCTFLEPDFKDVIRLYPSTVGEYAIAENSRNEVDTVYRQRPMQVIQMVEKFGMDTLSDQAKRMYENGDYYSFIDVTHGVTPRKQRKQNSPQAKDKPFASVWFEDAANREDMLLLDSGFDRFPALCPRWETDAGDVYGSSPGMDALGDNKQLMHEHLRKAQALDYQTNPPLQVPAIFKGQQVNRLPGGVIFVDPGSAAQSVKPAYEVNLQLDHLLADIVDIRERLNKAFFVDLFLMITNIERSNVTAREVAGKEEEKLLMLGPTLQSLDIELLTPIVEFTFEECVRNRILPPPPKELQGNDLAVEFIGVLAQAQRAVGIGATDRIIGTIGSVAQLKPDVLDKLDADQLVDLYADMLGVDPSIIVADDKVAIIRQQRAQQMEQQQSVESAGPMADALKTMSETDPTKPSVLSEV